MFKRLSVIALTIALCLNLAGCLSIAQKLNAYVAESQARDREQWEKKERRKMLDKQLNTDPRLIYDATIQSLIGSHTGNACNGKIKVAINFTYLFNYPVGVSNSLFLAPDPEIIYVVGKMRRTDQSGRIEDNYIRGRINVKKAYKEPFTIELTREPDLRGFIELVTGKNDHINQLLLDDAAKNSSLLDTFEQKFGTRLLEYGEGASKSISPVLIKLASDATGKGWEGAYITNDNDDCHDITLKNNQGNNGKFPPLNGKTAFIILNGQDTLSDNATSTTGLDYKTILKNRIYWGKIAEKLGIKHTDENNGIDNVLVRETIADTYRYLAEAEQQSSEQYYHLAREYYLKNANEVGDPRAQMMIANIYREGLGVPINIAEADKWKVLGTKKMEEDVKKACSSQVMVRAMYVLLERLDRKSAFVGRAISELSDIDINLGESRIVMIYPDNISPSHGTFTCTAITKSDDAGADASNAPDYIEYTDTYGRTYTIDKSLEKGVRTIGAYYLDKFLQNKKETRHFRVSMLGHKKYNVENELVVDLQ